jgi:hypothetical protein
LRDNEKINIQSQVKAAWRTWCRNAENFRFQAGSAHGQYHSAILAKNPASGQIWPVAIDVLSGGWATLRAFGSIHSVQLNRLIRSKEFIF